VAEFRSQGVLVAKPVKARFGLLGTKAAQRAKVMIILLDVVGLEDNGSHRILAAAVRLDLCRRRVKAPAVPQDRKSEMPAKRLEDHLGPPHLSVQ